MALAKILLDEIEIFSEVLNLFLKIGNLVLQLVYFSGFFFVLFGTFLVFHGFLLQVLVQANDLLLEVDYLVGLFLGFFFELVRLTLGVIAVGDQLSFESVVVDIDFLVPDRILDLFQLFVFEVDGLLHVVELLHKIMRFLAELLPKFFYFHFHEIFQDSLKF